MRDSLARPAIWSMAVVHQYYRREFELAPRIVRDIAPRERRRQGEAAYWFAVTLAMMHHHHVIEDELMYPLLEGRIDSALLRRMDEQHCAVANAVKRTEDRLNEWRHGDPVSAAALAAAFDDLVPILVEHLDDEEDNVMPLVAELLTVEEYGRQGTSGNDVFDDRTLMLAFGAMVEQAEPAESQVMLSHPPDHVRAAWAAGGAAGYQRLMTLLRGQLRPIPRRLRIADAASSHG